MGMVENFPTKNMKERKARLKWKNWAKGKTQAILISQETKENSV